MAKEIQDKIRIGAHNWEIRVLPASEMDPPTQAHLEQNQLIGKHYTHFGSMIPGDTAIEINSDIKPSMTAETMMHEVLHALIELGGVRGLFKRGREEEITQNLGHGLTQVLQDNPWFRRLFVKKRRKRRTR